MPSVTIAVSRDAGALDWYVSHEEAHDGSGQRFFFQSAHGASARYFVQDVRATMNRHQKRSLKIETFHVIQSYDLEEAAPDDLEEGLRVHQRGRAFARRAFPGHQFKVTTQRDGRAGLWHNHIQVANVSHVSAVLEWKSRDKQSGLLHERREPRPAGRAFSPAMRNVFRLRHSSDDLHRELDGYSVKAMMERRAPRTRSTTADVERRAAGSYNWRDDLRERCDDAAAQASSVDDYMNRLQAVGVEVRERGDDKNLSYGFMDGEGKERKARAGGRIGLGSDYSRKGIEQLVIEHTQARKQVAATLPAPVAPAAVPARVAPIRIDAAPSAAPQAQLETPSDDPLELLRAEYGEELGDLEERLREEAAAEDPELLAPIRDHGVRLELESRAQSGELRAQLEEARRRPAEQPVQEVHEVQQEELPSFGDRSGGLGAALQGIRTTEAQPSPEPVQEAVEAPYRSGLRDMPKSATERTREVAALAAQFDEEAREALRSGGRIEEAKVPKRIGPRFLQDHGERFDASVLAVLHKRAAKKQAVNEAHEEMRGHHDRTEELRKQGMRDDPTMWMFSKDWKDAVKEFDKAEKQHKALKEEVRASDYDSPADKAAKAREKAFGASGGLAQKVKDREGLFKKNSFRGGADEQQELRER